jgi:hypothetical protein
MLTVLRLMVRDPAGRLVLLWAVAQVLTGTLVFRWLEGWSTINALYFSVVTLATVGFGDLHPTTDVAKLFTIAYIVCGLGVIAAFISELTKYRVQLITELRTSGAAALHDPGHGRENAPTPGSPATQDDSD